ncbi:MAG: PIN domain-containing protein [Pseudomonadota bacterium]
MIYLDTHVVAWLYQGARAQFSKRAQALIADNALSISPMVVLELDYLYETKRVREPAARVLRHLQRQLALSICDKPFADIVAAAHYCAWTRDPFDRLIVAHASLEENTLLTKDKAIHAHYRAAVW